MRIGLGVELLGSKGIVLVVDIFPNGPAANEKNIQIGDHLLEVDGPMSPEWNTMKFTDWSVAQKIPRSN